MSGFDVAVGAVGIVSFGITVCQGLLDYYHTWKDAESNVKRMYDSIEMVTKIFILLKSSLDKHPPEKDILDLVNESVDACKSGVETLEKELKEIKINSPKSDGWKEKLKAQIRRTLYPFHEPTLDHLVSISTGLQDNLKLAMGVLQM
jgi:ankyrin repeat domain-containing protein 50